MADWYVPLATGTIPQSINAQIAQGPNLSWIGDLPNDYWQGQNQQYAQRNRDVFQGGLPKDANGNVDFNAAYQALVQAGGASAAGNLWSAQKAGIIQKALGDDSGTATPNPNGGYPQTTRPALPPSSQGGAVAQQQPQQQPAQGQTQSVSQWAAQVGVDPTALAQALGMDPNAQISPSDARLRPALASARSQGSGGPGTAAGAPAATVGLAPGGQPAAPATPAAPTRLASGDATAGALPAPAAPPPPQSADQLNRPTPVNGQVAPPAQAAQPAQQAAQADQQQTDPSKMSYGDMKARADYLMSLSNRATQSAGALEIAEPGSGKALQAKAEELARQSAAMVANWHAVNDPTQTQKDFQSGVTGQVEAQKADIAKGQKTYDGMVAAANQFERDLKPYNSVTRGILSSGDVYTGLGGEQVLKLAQARAAAGDPKAAALMEGLQKITAQTVLSQINTQKDQMQEAGANSSRIFSTQIDQINKASPQLITTTGGNLFLINMADRMGQLSSTVAQMARDYKATHPLGLDAGFDQQLSNYMDKSPVFTKAEQDHPWLLSRPTIPSDAGSWSPEQKVAWGAKFGLKPGDLVNVSPGKYGPIPRITVPSVPPAQRVQGAQ
jgi:hypothetical protein